MERLGVAGVLGTPVLVLIVVLWLFVLAPIALRSRKPIRHTNEAFEETRVIHEGGTALAATRRRPRLGAENMHVTVEDDADYEVIDEDDILLDDPQPEDAAEGMARPFSKIGQAFSKFAKPEPAEVVEGGVVAELPAPAEAPIAEAEEELAPQSDAVPLGMADFYDDEPTTYPYDDAYTNPADFLHPDADYGEAVAVTGGEDPEEDDWVDEAEEADDPELSEEDLAFAARRRGRGGYDPEADAQTTSDRFQRRQRTLVVIGAALVVALIAGAVFGGMAWIAPAIVAAICAGYLYVLRQQVRAENELRARRIRHMRRARLGVRTVEGQELGMPSRLRRPGAVVLELDDDSADFADLPETTATIEYEPANSPEHAYPAPRRVS